MKKGMIALFLGSFISLSAQEKFLVNPVPQQTNFSAKSIETSKFLTSEGKWNSKVITGEKNNVALKKMASKVPNSPEGYYISISEKNIFVVGNSPRGTFYGKQTLHQLFEKETLPLGEITDFPSLEHRGVVEGFYGTPWSHEKRLRQLDFYGENKLNVYIYGPKDDPYHSSPNWRLPYPEKEAQQIKELVAKANANFVDFVWAIHPGKDIQWNDTDRQHLLQKFEGMYALGVRAFAVFFDDISGEGTNPQKQAELLNFLHENFVQKKKNVQPIIMCPTEYNKSWSNPSKKYLETLGEKLHPSIQIMWTGNRVVADIDKPSLDWINQKIKRKAYIWWNFPVSDYVRNHLLLGQVYGNANDIETQMSGFVSNPMEHPEASKIAIYGVANYTWNMLNYNSKATWHSAIARLMPKNKVALLTFAQHNSDLGQNGHRYRRNESEEFLPITQNFLLNFDEGTENPYFQKVNEEFSKIISSAEILSKTTENEYFIQEIQPWVLQFGWIGNLGQQTLKMYESLAKNNPENFERAYNEVQKIQKKLFENNQILNQNPYQPGVKTATRVVEPFINTSLEKLVTTFNKKYGKSLKLKLNFNPNTLVTNVLQLENVPLLQQGKKLRISPVLEFVTLKNNDFFSIELEKNTTILKVLVDFDNAEWFKNGKIQISQNGKDWQTLEGNVKNTRWIHSSKMENVKQIRFVNLSSSQIEFQLKQFEIEME